MKYFALLDNEEIKPLGDHPDFSSADDAAPGNTHWILTEDTLRTLQENITKALEPQ